MATIVGHRNDRFGERVDEFDDPDEATAAGPVRCDRGFVIAADRTCCVKHDRGIPVPR